MDVRIGGRFNDGNETLEPVGDARYASVFCPGFEGGYANADIEGDG